VRTYIKPLARQPTKDLALWLGSTLFDRGQKIDNHLATRLGAEIAFAVDLRGI
jgi:hypothetical protein